MPPLRIRQAGEETLRLRFRWSRGVLRRLLRHVERFALRRLRLLLRRRAASALNVRCIVESLNRQLGGSMADDAPQQCMVSTRKTELNWGARAARRKYPTSRVCSGWDFT